MEFTVALLAILSLDSVKSIFLCSHPGSLVKAKLGATSYFYNTLIKQEIYVNRIQKQIWRIDKNGSEPKCNSEHNVTMLSSVLLVCSTYLETLLQPFALFNTSYFPQELNRRPL